MRIRTRGALVPALLLLVSSAGGAAAAEREVFPFPVHARTLANGLQVVAIPFDSPGIVAYVTVVRTGSRDEVEPGNDGLNRPYHRGGGYLSWRQISTDYLHREGYVRHWDERAQAPWLWNAQRRHFISYDDPQSLRAKAAFVREQGLGGIMYWEHATDADEQLLDAVDAGLREAAKP